MPEILYLHPSYLKMQRRQAVDRIHVSEVFVQVPSSVILPDHCLLLLSCFRALVSIGSPAWKKRPSFPHSHRMLALPAGPDGVGGQITIGNNVLVSRVS